MRAPIGPNPIVAAKAGSNGDLQVFSATVEQNDVGYEFPYFQRTDYYIFDSNGKQREHVSDNNRGHFDDTPRAIQLPPGTYKVKALMAEGFGQWMILPVVVEPGRTTRVHLNGHWEPPPDTPKSELVQAPGRGPVGWRAVSPAGS